LRNVVFVVVERDKRRGAVWVSLCAVELAWEGLLWTVFHRQ